MGRIFILLAFLFIGLKGSSQLNDDFSDGDFTANPAWTGSAADWIVNPAFQLQSNNTTANGIFQIVTANTLATSAQWDLYTQLTFNTSGANYVDIFLVASNTDLASSANNGYFVRIGNTDDEISLYRKDGATSVKIIDGTNGITNSSNNILRIRVIRDNTNNFTLFRDAGNTGVFTSEGSVADATYTSSAFFGIYVRQSTASFFQRHFFDNISITTYTPDVTAPQVSSVSATGANSIDVLFNEPVEITSAENELNYSVDNGIGFPASAIRDNTNTALVHLVFSNSFPIRQDLNLSVSGVRDLALNEISAGSYPFMYSIPLRYEVVINELMADPTPEVGLPNTEWIELKNVSSFPVDLQGWRIGDATSLSGPMPSYILMPGAYVTVSSTSGAALLAGFGPSIAVSSFPSLDNGGDLVFIRSAEGLTIHSVQYSDTWYQNELKRGGGWTLEMMDNTNPCSGSTNWIASVAPAGGTPAALNSVNGSSQDQTAPQVVYAFVNSPNSITVVFNEPLDSLSAVQTSSYVIDNGIGNAVAASAAAPLFNSVQLTLGTTLVAGTVYNITINNVKDCSQNSVQAGTVVSTGIAQGPDSFDIVINEILFNPHPGSVDYVELYNRSQKVIDLSKVYIANRNSSGTISSITRLIEVPRPLLPGQFVVLTENPSFVMHHYVANDPSAFLAMNSLPSFNDDKGFVIILNEQGNIVDEVNYDDDWHFSLISNEEGVSLERIRYDGPSNDRSNWHSASSSVNYGTPTYKNSQSMASQAPSGSITITPSTISPDNDGRDDFTLINYQFPKPGYVMNITIFDAVGRPVRSLLRNGLSGLSGSYRWDGLDDKSRRLLPGIYIIYSEVFDLDGKSDKFRNVIVIAK